MSSEQCELLRQLSSNYPYQILIAVKCVFCFLGASGLCYQWYKQGVRFLVHENTKVLFTFYYALNSLLAIGNGAIYVFELIRLRFDCVVLEFRYVLLSKGTMTCVGMSAHNIMMLIAFERLYSVLFPAKFEKHSNKRLFGIITGIAVVIITCTFVMYGLSDGFTLFGERTVPFLEDKIPANARSFDKVLLFLRITHLLSPAVFCIDLYINFIKKKPIASSTLSISYQRAENRRIILVILPIEIAEALLGISATFAIMFHGKFIDITKPIERLLFMEIFAIPMFFPLIVAVIMEFRVARITRTSVTETYQAVDHFESLKRAWQ